MRPSVAIALLCALPPVLALQVPTHNDTNYNFPTTPHEQTPKTPLLNTTLECHDIRHVPRDDQCQFALDHCGDYEIGFVNYVSLYYCQSGRFLTFSAYALLLVSLFATLGITAAEFLCPNLDTIAKFFRMSESLAGVTLLALGNGSPDVFSTLEAMKINAADLAIGELVGAALFITAVVVGSMAIVHPFTVVKRPFVRDVLFLLLSVTLTTVFLSDGEISILEAIAMILLYACYVVFVVSWDWLITKRRRTQLLDQKVRNHFFDDTARYNLAEHQVEESTEINDEDILNDLGASGSAGIDVLDKQLAHESESSFDEWTRRSMIQRIRPSILTALDMNNRMHDFSDAADTSAISLATLPGRPPSSSDIKRSTPSIQMSSAPVFRDTEEEDAMSYNEYEARVSKSAPASYDYDRYHDDPASRLEMNGELPDLFDAHDTLKNFLDHNDFLKDSGFISSFFPTLKDFSTQALSEKIISVLCILPVTMLRLTIPVINTLEDKQIDNEAVLGRGFPLLIIQCLISPFVSGILMFYNGSLTPALIMIPLILSCFFILLAFTFKNHHSKGNHVITYIFTCCLSCGGFIISINWISTIATELIAIIKFFAVYFDLSDAILGVTVFAIGNSLGDFISNFTIARMGFPTMALSACFGGPLLNILLGIGGSALYVIPLSGENIEVTISKTLIVSGVTLYVNLVALLFVVPMNGWQMNKPIGLFMIGLWSCATFVCVILEMFS